MNLPNLSLKARNELAKQVAAAMLSCPKRIARKALALKIGEALGFVVLK